ncbi:MAG: ABC transporter permease [Firmicutes bacterium]|nr:ABC transporter permease [Bacillota bacterium]
MSKFFKRIGKRIVAGLVMILAVSSFTFFLVHFMPGNPVQTKLNTLIEEGIPPLQAQAQVRSMYGFIPHQPLYIQYFHYVWQVLHLNLGKSISYSGVPVMHLLLKAMPWTVIMVLTGLAVSFIIGITAGVIASVKRNSKLGDGLLLLSTFLHGIPQFIMALGLAYVFTTIFKIFPFGAPYNAAISPGFTIPFIGSLARHAVLPIAAYAISGFGAWALTMRASVTSVLGDDYILAAELRGVTPSIRLRYIARNAMLPLFTILTLSVGFMFGGSIFIETIFDYPGLGYTINTALAARDYPLMDGAFLMITAAVIIATIVADLLYTVLDPRIQRI